MGNVNPMDVAQKWSLLSQESQDGLRKFFTKSIKAMPVDVLILRQSADSMKSQLKRSLVAETLQTGILAALVIINLLVMLALVIYYTCSKRTERASELPPCTCAIEATQETVNRKLKGRHRMRDYGYIRYTNVANVASRH